MFGEDRRYAVHWERSTDLDAGSPVPDPMCPKCLLSPVFGQSLFQELVWMSLFLTHFPYSQLFQNVHLCLGAVSSVFSLPKAGATQTENGEQGTPRILENPQGRVIEFLKDFGLWNSSQNTLLVMVFLFNENLQMLNLFLKTQDLASTHILGSKSMASDPHLPPGRARFQTACWKCSYVCIWGVMGLSMLLAHPKAHSTE